MNRHTLIGDDAPLSRAATLSEPGPKRRRSYNAWVADETMEDYALRFTAKSARRFTPFQLAMTAVGGISFLALEAIGGTITLQFGAASALPAIAVVSILIFFAALPISYYAAKHGVDIDLLTRGAGFGYLGSTVTSLIYACFTFIFFAIEAAIMALALDMVFGLPTSIGYVVCAFAVIPIVTHGITWISRFQIWTQPLWLVLNLAPFITIAAHQAVPLSEWTQLEGSRESGPGFDLILFGGAASILFALTAQIGEQVDFLRFLPRRTRETRRAWWAALIAGGPGWIVIGAAKIVGGSILAYLVLREGFGVAEAQQPTQMYRVAFGYVLPNETLALLAAGLFVVVAQMKINVTNAYAGSIAWSNFFSRLTHHHPGRVVWLVFNVMIALLLMEMGVLRALEKILGLYGILAVSWVAALVADLAINKPLGLSPPGIEFKRAHLYDINPVGFGAMGAGILVAGLAYVGLFGEMVSALASFAALVTAFCASPLIAVATRGRFYVARVPKHDWGTRERVTCEVCQHTFEIEDMAHCPAHDSAICSLCCTLETCCRDMCKTESRVREQVFSLLRRRIWRRAADFATSPAGHYLVVFATMLVISGGILSLIALQASLDNPGLAGVVRGVLLQVFIVFAIVAGIVSWLYVLAHASRRKAQADNDRQTRALTDEIAAHDRTDAALQLAKDKAESASLAKTRFVIGMSHELRTPLNSILGFAQIMEGDGDLPERRRKALRTIRRSGEHLASLVDGLLDISRIEAGKLQMESAPFALEPLLRQIAEIFEAQAKSAGIAFVLDIAHPLPAMVRGDEKRVRQILINLLSNAVKFTSTGSVTLRVRYRSQIAEIDVIDTGFGIAPADVGRVFEPFERTAAGVASAPGLGLGLTITKLLAEILGGDIRVASEVGAGSRFTVRLMMSSVAGEATPADVGRRIVGYEGRRRTVLVVDDEPDHRRLLEDLLGPLGLTVLTSASGEDALSLARLAEPDGFVLDQSMPGMTGTELATRLHNEGHDGPIVMLSADTAIPFGHAAGPAPAWVTKPIDVSAFLHILGSRLGLSWRHADEPIAELEDIGVAPGESKPGDIHGSAFDDLAAMLRIGYAAGARAQLDALVENDPGMVPLASELSAHLDAFAFDKAMDVIARARQ